MTDTTEIIAAIEDRDKAMAEKMDGLSKRNLELADRVMHLEQMDPAGIDAPPTSTSTVSGALSKPWQIHAAR